ncbi:MAG: hypothetical protein KID00_14605 [Clostridium argentinense]|nr:hypothetical protein [Clostridium argentinense]
MIYFPLEIESINYNCSICGGTCCNINGSLKFTNKQVKQLPSTNLLKDYIKKEVNYYTCRIPKRCWFLNSKKCSLNNELKPLECILYPFVVWKINNEIIICEINPCPDIEFNGNSNFNKSTLIKNIENYEKGIGIDVHPFMKKIIFKENIILKEKIKYEKNIFLSKSFNNTKENVLKNNLIRLFFQIRVHPIILHLNEKELNIIESIYNKLCDEYINCYKTDNFQNLYIVVRNEILKRSLLLFYFPINNELFYELNKNEQNLLTEIKKNNLNLFQGKCINLFFKFFRDNNTKWLKISPII